MLFLFYIKEGTHPKKKEREATVWGKRKELCARKGEAERYRGALTLAPNLRKGSLCHPVTWRSD